MATNPTAAQVLAGKRKSLGAYKGHLTKAVDAFKALVALVEEVVPTTQEVEALTDLYRSLGPRLTKVENAADQLAELDPARAEEYLDIEEYIDMVEEARILYVRTAAKIKDVMVKKPPAEVRAGAGGGQAARPRPVSGLKPNPLMWDASRVHGVHTESGVNHDEKQGRLSIQVMPRMWKIL
jgi:hypothetical protein